MKTTIPEYRAKKIDSDEYIIGNLNKVNGNLYLNGTTGDLDDTDYGWGFVEIDPTTLSIHFPDMLDREGTKIFASLQEDGKGGDMVDLGYNYLKYTMKVDKSLFLYSFLKAKVIGIQK